MVSQLVANGVITASTIIVLAVSFALILQATRFFHFAHGAVFAFGAYSAYAFSHYAGMSLCMAFLAAMGASAALGIALESVVYRPLRMRNASSTTLLLASLGLYVVLVNVTSIVFGNDTRTIATAAISGGVEIRGARVTAIQVWTITISAALVLLTHLLQRVSRFGEAIRAVASNPELAKVTGVDTDAVILRTFGLGSALAGAAGTLVALDIGMVPTMGMYPLMLAVVAVMIGGMGSVPGIVLGGTLLGMVQHFGVWRIGSQWQDAISFVILLGVLLMRPQGLFGRGIQKGAV